MQLLGDMIKELEDSQGPADLIDLFKGWKGWFVHHKGIVDQFGRFPHRNGILGREPTSEEEQGLKDGTIRRV